jgi:hypothetical protein
VIHLQSLGGASAKSRTEIGRPDASAAEDLDEVDVLADKEVDGVFASIPCEPD